MFFRLVSVCSLLFFFAAPLASATSLTGLLNQKEQTWLQQLQRPLRVGITAIPGQVSVRKNATYTGFAIDLFNKIAASSPLRFQFVYFNSWDEVIQAGRNRDVDIVFLAQQTAARLKYFDFSNTVLTQQNKIITRIGSQRHLSPQKLMSKSVAVTRGSAIFDYLQRNFPAIILVPMKNEEAALSYVSKGLADAAVSESVRASYFLEKLNIKNLHSAGDIAYNYHLRIASRNDFPVLNVILNKAVDVISDEEIPALHLKWGYVKDRETFFDTQTLIYLAIIFATIIPFTIYLYILSGNLRAEIRARKQVHAELEQAFDEIHTLQGLITICSYCKHIYDDNDGWSQLETYISKHSSAKFSHGICPNCFPAVTKAATSKPTDSEPAA